MLRMQLLLGQHIDNCEGYKMVDEKTGIYEITEEELAELTSEQWEVGSVPTFVEESVENFGKDKNLEETVSSSRQGLLRRVATSIGMYVGAALLAGTISLTAFPSLVEAQCSSVPEPTMSTKQLTLQEQDNIDCGYLHAKKMINDVENMIGANITADTIFLNDFSGSVDLEEVESMSYERIESNEGQTSYRTTFMLKNGSTQVIEHKKKITEPVIEELMYLDFLENRLNRMKRHEPNKECKLKITDNEKLVRQLIMSELECEDIAIVENYLFCKRSIDKLEQGIMLSIKLDSQEMEDTFSYKRLQSITFNYPWLHAMGPRYVEGVIEKTIAKGKEDLCEIKAWAPENLRDVYPLNMFCADNNERRELGDLFKRMYECVATKNDNHMTTSLSYYGVRAVYDEDNFHYVVRCKKSVCVDPEKSQGSHNGLRCSEHRRFDVYFDTREITRIEVENGERIATVTTYERTNPRVYTYHMRHNDALKLKALVEKIISR